jgi:hypothetical protein
MDERCPDCTCDVREKLENLQVLRHIMMKKKKEYEAMKLVDGEVEVSHEPEADAVGKPAI